jgi:isoquinoline 1-oxidoreductase alpha subunit
MISITVNGKQQRFEGDASTPLLWYLRDELGLTGTKFGCGVSACGACTVHLDGTAVPACVTPVSAAAGRKVTTIEALSPDGDHPVQRAWREHAVPQCGYCQSGQIMAAAALLARTPNPGDAEIDAAMAGNICRCGTYVRIREAIKAAAAGGK